MLKGTIHFILAATVIIVLAACAPGALPTPTPTIVPAPAAPKAPEPTKPPAPASTPTTAPSATPKPATLKFGSISAITDAAVYIAVEKGYFKEQGITTEVNNFRSVPELIAPLGTGQLDIIVTSMSAPLMAAADRGVDFKVVVGHGLSFPKWEYLWVLLRKDLAESAKVKSPADLKGMKVAIPSQGSLGDMVVQTMMEQAGLKPADVEVVVLAFADQAAAFANKAIAAGWLVEPFVIRSEQEGFATKWIPTSQSFGGKAQGGYLLYGSSLLKDRELGQRWMTAYLKGVRDYLKAFTTKEGRDEIVNILVKNTSVKDPKLYDVMEMPYLEPNLVLDKKSTDIQYKWFVDKGLYTGKKTFDDVLDLSYADYAVQRLGKQ